MGEECSFWLTPAAQSSYLVRFLKSSADIDIRCLIYRMRSEVRPRHQSAVSQDGCFCGFGLIDFSSGLGLDLGLDLRLGFAMGTFGVMGADASACATSSSIGQGVARFMRSNIV